MRGDGERQHDCSEQISLSFRSIKTNFHFTSSSPAAVRNPSVKSENRIKSKWEIMMMKSEIPPAKYEIDPMMKDKKSKREQKTSEKKTS